MGFKRILYTYILGNTMYLVGRNLLFAPPTLISFYFLIHSQKWEQIYFSFCSSPFLCIKKHYKILLSSPYFRSKGEKKILFLSPHFHSLILSFPFLRSKKPNKKYSLSSFSISHSKKGNLKNSCFSHSFFSSSFSFIFWCGSDRTTMGVWWFAHNFSIDLSKLSLFAKKSLIS